MAITIAELHAGPISSSPKPRRRPKPLSKAAERLKAERKDRQRLLLRLAEERGLTAEAEAPGQYLIRDPGVNGVVQITTAFSCTCSSWGIWRRCEHQALVKSLETNPTPEVQS
ncbi:MAG: hypothetical protein QM753_08790 [Thermomicrobiales bacterium]